MSGKSFEELDQEMAEQEREKIHHINGPEDQYAQFFYLYGHQYQVLIDNLSNNAVRRIAKALVMYPLSEKDYEHTTQEEKNALLIGMRLLESKAMILLHSLAEHANKEQQKKEQETPDNQQNNKGDLNGIGSSTSGE